MRKILLLMTTLALICETMVLGLVCLVAVPALAEKIDKSKTGPPLIVNADVQRALFESFERAWPPTGWTVFSASGHGDNENWTQGSHSAYDGFHSAECYWDPDFLYQDNTLSFTYPIAAGEDHLNFAISGSFYWSANYDCTVEIDGTVVYSWADNVVEDWTYMMVDLDLSAYTGMTVEIAFHYTGLNGAAIFLDAVGINDGPPPPPEPPLNDTCQGALENGFELAPGAFSYTGNNYLASNDYALYGYWGSCTGYSFTGRDVVWFVCLDQGDELQVTFTSHSGCDVSIFLVTDCADPMGTCVIGADNVQYGPESFTYIAETTNMYFLIAGGYSDFCWGIFTLSGYNSGDGCVVSTEKATWDGVKALYR